ncbi:MAG: T9SS type A sorting domain-containing protein, partial [Saprospiraceae bacterium]|nr:T9SS type A sorting domain-containing protein [Saprospiraceae bacterium]
TMLPKLSIDVDGDEPTTFSAEIIGENLREMAAQAACDGAYFRSIEALYYVGFELARAYMLAGTVCTDCLADALIEVESNLLDLGSIFLYDDRTQEGQQLIDLAKKVQRLYLAINSSDDDDLILDQNAIIGDQVVQVIGQLNQLFPDRFYSCTGGETTAESDSNPACSVTEMVALSQDTHSKAFVARSNADSYSWRYRTQGGQWINAEETDSIFVLTIDSSLTYEVQVSAWCERVLDFSDYVAESVVYNYSYGCYAPTYYNLTVSNIQQTSAMLHVSRYSSKIQWAYREVGKNWRYYTTDKSSVRYSGLKPGYTYEFTCRLWCNHSWTSWAPAKRFTCKSQGCIVYRPSVSSVTSTSAKTTSNHSGKKQWAFRKKGGHWKYYTNAHSWMKWTCQPSTTYEVAIRIICHGKWSKWCTPVTWTTKGNHCYAPSSGALQAYNISETAATTHVNISASAYKWAIRKKGGKWYYYSDDDPTYFWTGLSASTTYEFAVKIYCGGYWTAYSPIKQFSTKGYSCQSPKPQHIYYSHLTSNSVILHITTNANTIEYALYRSGWSDWKIWRSSSKTFSITKLLSNQVYQYTMRVYCNGAWTNWAPVESFRTKVEGRSAENVQRDELSEGGTAPTRTLSGMLMQNDNQVPAENAVHTPVLNQKDSIEKNRSIELVIYPNPATEYFKITTDVKTVAVTIIDMQGQVVLHVANPQPEHQFELQSLRPGQYQVVADDETGNRIVKKLIVIR